MSVMQDMTNGIAGTDIVARKAAKATKLTAVAGETTTTVEEAAAALIPDVPGGVFLAAEAVADIARDLRAQATKLIDQATVLNDVANGLDKYQPEYLKTPDAPAKPSKVEARLVGKDPEPKAEDLPDVSGFAEDYAAKQEAAKAATFTALDDGAPATPATGWVCPDHGSKDLTTITPRKGQPYLMCGVGTCEHYERLT